MTAYPNNAFWRGRRVLVTGHTGFKGAWLTLWLDRMGARVTGIALPPQTEPNLFTLAGVEHVAENHFLDIRESTALASIIHACCPEIVFHLAAQSLVLASYDDPLGTFSCNVQGTANVLNAVRDSNETRVFVATTTDKVYLNLEHALPFRETDPLGGQDPYSGSKAAAEIVIASYRDSFLAKQGVAVASARAGNVIGGGDWSRDRLIADAVRAWGTATSLKVRRPQAIRPWQHVLEPLAGYLRLAEKLWDDSSVSGGYNFGPHTHEAATVREVLTMAREAYGRGEIEWGDGAGGAHEAGWLTLEVAKARRILGVEPRWSLAESVRQTMEWYRSQAEGAPAIELCQDDISAFEAAGASSARDASA